MDATYETPLGCTKAFSEQRRPFRPRLRAGLSSPESMHAPSDGDGAASWRWSRVREEQLSARTLLKSQPSTGAPKSMFIHSGVPCSSGGRA
ncbi:Hypothetical predicted protein [Cloeon dipterum]|uniref:Uncharacterized protein n=1 Tax=Cloeon dipterum TaxID=197152 RepID=A0A8S1E434_9INSE|nr:Hypothetical predicted protein [Cloeon dipterum]